MKIQKVRLSPALGILAFVLTIFGFQKKYFLLFSAAAIHELGHATAIRLYSGEIEQIRLIPGGLDIRYRQRNYSYASDILIAAAGPLANLAAAILLRVLHINSDYLIGLHLILCFFNLLPLYPLDGGKVLCSVICYFAPIRGETAFYLWSGTLSILLFTAACGACFYNLRALWSVLIFGYILYQQKLRLMYREAI